MAAPSGMLLLECFSKFAQILNVPESSELFEYICGIDDEHDLVEYLRGLLDDSNSENNELIIKFVAAWRAAPKKSSAGEDTHVDTTKNSRPSKGNKHSSTVTMPAKKNSSSSKNKINKDQSKHRDGVKQPSPAKSSGNAIADTLVDVDRNCQSTNDSRSPGSDHQATPKSAARKVHYSPLYSEEGQDMLVVKLPGRHRCECQATKHRLVNNCLKCGRIVCSQEGSGPCHFCGDLVCTNEEQEMLDRDSKQSHQLLKKLSSQKPKKSDGHVSEVETSSLSDLKKAVEHKDRLLEFDRTVKQRTKVIDDQSDFFGADNRWLSPEEKAVVVKREREINEKRENERKVTKVTFDFAGRKIIEDKYDDNCVLAEEEILRLTLKKKLPNSDVMRPEFGRELPRPIYDPSCIEETRKDRNVPHVHVTATTNMRLQDRELQQMSDDGQCMSLHQPYASLVVAGLKKHEGRSWYSPLRGRLWIASTAKTPLQQDIRDEENTIRALNHGVKLEFPKSYPTSALLGCVNVVDCLPQEDYREQFPDGESTTPYVFICDNPQVLTMKFPIRGERKIYKLNEDIHRTAKLSIKNSAI